MKIIGLYSSFSLGNNSIIGKKRSATGIFKSRVESVLVNELGIVGDLQADKRFHGGPEKALHQYALSAYEKIIQRYPLLHKKAQPGSIGENITGSDMHDRSVCIGDIYQLGGLKVQVSSPRIPCWKIDEKFKQPNLHSFIGSHQITGWYYRVLEGGKLTLDDHISLLEQGNPDLSIATFMQIVKGQITNKRLIKEGANAKGLDPEWQTRLLAKL
jgi:MOSC domain-containing protein YiiM